MKEIGGYIELDNYYLPMLHEGAVALNCGRNGLAYLFKSKKIKSVKLPYFICSSVLGVCDREGIEKNFYHVGMDFMPAEDLLLKDNEWLYLINYYGQLSNDTIKKYVDQYKRVIVDNANAYFQDPIDGVDTIYTCRKWFGVADGAFLYTDMILDDVLPQDESYNRMRFLLGRFERSATEFYSEYNNNNKYFVNEPIKSMSKLTNNLLHGIDYDAVRNKRVNNFNYLHNRIGYANKLQLREASFMYPLMVANGAVIRKELQRKKIYIPTLWPTVFNITNIEDVEHKMAENILPLPIDQRYNLQDMDTIIENIRMLI